MRKSKEEEEKGSPERSVCTSVNILFWNVKDNSFKKDKINIFFQKETEMMSHGIKVFINTQ